MDVAVEVVKQLSETGRMLCPKCSHTRKKSKEKSLSVTVYPDRRVWDCHHCGWEGAVKNEDPLAKYRHKNQKKVTPLPTKLKHDSDLTSSFFKERGIEIEGHELPRLTTGTKYFPALDRRETAIGFVYGPQEQPEAIKWRPANGEKTFVQDNSAASFYGLERLPEEPEELIIVEGEADVVALASIGVVAISCPNGAPAKVSKSKTIDPEEDGKFSFVWDSRQLLERAKKIVIAVDGDEPGDALAEELARRIGRAKCYRTKYPEGTKDPTDVIVKAGQEAMLDILDKSEPFPLSGVYDAQHYAEQLTEIYLNGEDEQGISTGIPTVDNLFTVKEGMLYVVTGIPSSGKSEFIDQIMVNTSMKNDWRWAVASFENPPAYHMSKLAEKINGKPFRKGPNQQMNRTELEEAVHFIDDHFVFLESKDGSMPTMQSVIDRAKQAVMRLGVRGLVIDPYNYIDIGKAEGEHQAITKMLTEVVAFARAYNVAVFFVAHPAKMYPNENGKYPVPKGMHISGSAAWFAKTDIGFTVHRGKQGVEIHCWKVRFKWLGEQGVETIGYDVPTGRYFDGSEPWAAPIDLSADTDRDAPPVTPHWQDRTADWDL